MKTLFRITLVYILVINHLSVNGQSLGQDTESFSTIVYPSTNISLNLNESAASFSIYRDSRVKNEKPARLTILDNAFKAPLNNTPKKIRDALAVILTNNNSILDKSKSNKYFTWGLDFKGESSNGIAPIFSSDKIASSSSINGLFGYRWTRHKFKEDQLQNYVYARIATNKKSEIIKKIDELLKNKTINKTNKKALIKFTKIDNISDEINNLDFVIQEIPTIKAPVENSLNSEINYLVSLSAKITQLQLELNKEPPNEATIFKIKDLMKKEIDSTEFAGLSNFLGFNAKNIYASKWDSIQKNIADITLLKKDQARKIGSVPVYNGTDELNALLQLYKDYKKGLLILKETKAKNSDVLLNDLTYSNTFLIYARGGVIGSDFRFDLKNDGTTVDTRFKNRSFNGYTMEIGITKQFSTTNFFGFSTAYSYNHNLSDLRNQTFALQVVDPTITDGNFVSVTEIKALTGDYDKFHRLDFNFDYAHLLTLKENQNSDKISYLYLSLNPYIRHRIYENANRLKNNTVLGLGVHAYNSKDNKVMGGIYIQTQDLFGVHKNDKGIFDEGITFGLIVKYNFEGLKPKA